MSLLKDKVELDIDLAELRAKQALDRFPPVLRWILIICVIGTIPAYYIAKNASAGFWGGRYKALMISARPSFTNPQNPKQSDVSLTKASDNTYGAAILISNPNLSLSLPPTPYTFTFFDNTGSQVYQESGTLFLLPNQSAYVVAPRFTSQSGVARANFAFTSPLNWQKRANIPKVDIQASQPNSYNQIQPPAFVAEGSYLNNSPYQLAQVRLVFLVYNSGHNIVGVSERTDYTIAPYERRGYKQIWPNIFAGPGTAVKVFSYTDPLDPANLNLPAASGSPASDLSRPALSK